MADENLKRDQNFVTVIGGVTDDAAQEIRMIRVDPITNRVLASATGLATGTVTSIAASTGILLTPDPITTTGTVGLATSLAPMATLAGNALKVLRVNAGETAVEYATISTGLVVGTTTITSGTTTRILYDNAGVLGEYTITGTGTVVAMQTNPTLSGITLTDATNIVLNTTTGTKIGTATTQKLAFYNSTPIVQPTGDVVTALQNLGLVASATVASATNINTATEATDTTCFPVFVTASGTQTLPAKTNTTLTYNSNTNDLGVTKINGLTMTASTGTFTLTNAKTLSVTNTLTLSGTDSTVMTFPTTSATIARTDAGQTFTGVQVMTSPSITTANLTGTQLLAENASIGLDPAGSADGKYTGITVTATAGYTQAFGDLVYIDPTDSRWEACDANSAAGADGDSRGIIGMVVVPGTDGNSCTILLNGIIRADAKFPTFTVNNPIYVSETAGLVTQTQPSTTDVVIRVVGFALTTDEMYFNPDGTYITHT